MLGVGWRRCCREIPDGEQQFVTRGVGKRKEGGEPYRIMEQIRGPIPLNTSNQVGYISVPNYSYGIMSQKGPRRRSNQPVMFSVCRRPKQSKSTAAKPRQPNAAKRTPQQTPGPSECRQMPPFQVAHPMAYKSVAAGSQTKATKKKKHPSMHVYQQHTR